jgi:bifunctional DNA-binding transcriptional regulator/antitoxin component of YhaV-PrlF toxin-antitoxin module
MESSAIHEFDPAHMKEAAISKGGQISIPADVRRRWGTDRVRLVDLGDRLIVRPLGADDLAVAKGSLPLPTGMTAEGLRAIGRDEDATVEQGRAQR